MMAGAERPRWSEAALPEPAAREGALGPAGAEQLAAGMNPT